MFIREYRCKLKFHRKGHLIKMFRLVFDGHWCLLMFHGECWCLCLLEYRMLMFIVEY